MSERRLNLMGLLFLLILVPATGRAEQAGTEAQSAAPPNRVRSLTVLPSTDTSTYGLGPQLQAALTSLFMQTRNFGVQQSGTPLSGFSEADVARGIQVSQTELMAFVYLETERITLFLFDMTRPKEFCVVAQTLVDPMLGNQVTTQVIEYKMRLGFNTLLTQYYSGQFSPLPGSEGKGALATAAPDDPKVRAEESRKVFRELANLETGKYYMGASVGMARYAGGDSSASTVNFGAFGGMKAGDRTNVEAGFDFFAYAMFYVDGRYQMPIAERYVTMNLTLGLARVLGGVATPQFAKEATLKSGFMFGPGISFDIPLLGANVRGEFKLYFGGGSVLLGSYGISYSI